jgi:hypothetical protein
VPLDKGLAFGLDRISEAMATLDRVEGMQASGEKRKPVFTGEEPHPERTTKRISRKKSGVGASKIE